jgi:hypothetical protein
MFYDLAENRADEGLERSLADDGPRVQPADKRFKSTDLLLIGGTSPEAPAALRFSMLRRLSVNAFTLAVMVSEKSLHDSTSFLDRPRLQLLRSIWLFGGNENPSTFRSAPTKAKPALLSPISS